MNTFLPFPDFERSAKCLDRARLGKQRVEVLQLLRVLLGETRGWANHPAAKMWRGYEPALALYGACVCRGWVARGYRDTCLDKIAAYACDDVVYPPWLGDAAFHESHQSNLTRKDAAHYSKFWSTPAGLPYVWPDPAKGASHGPRT